MSMANCTMYITFWCIGQNISHNYYCCCCLSLRAFESDLCYIFITFCLLNSQNKAGAGITTWYDWLILVQEESLKTNIVLSKLLYMPYPFHVACNFRELHFVSIFDCRYILILEQLLNWGKNVRFYQMHRIHLNQLTCKSSYRCCAWCSGYSSCTWCYKYNSSHMST